ncbi:MAG: glycine dehydrogenase, partial [Alphaproteobacteria bacterium]|nr:glycine dehydrogenase [Alphaproteobacteria bacterium]
RKLAALNHDRAVMAADKLSRIKGVELVTPTFFNEFTLKLSKPAAPIVDALAKQDIIAGVPVSRLKPHDKAATNLLLVAVTETTTPADIEAFAAALTKVLS